MGPGRYPQYTRADYGQEAVGSSATEQAPGALHRRVMSPQQSYLNMVAERWECKLGCRESGTRYHRRRNTTLSRRVAWFDPGDVG